MSKEHLMFYSELIALKVNLYFNCSFTNSTIGKQRSKQSRDRSVCIAEGYGLDGRGSIPGMGKYLPSAASRPVLGPADIPMGTGGSFPKGKAAEAWI
jgi:hypothetical protein